MILSLTDVTTLKKAFADKFSAQIHFCDSCGGQSFKVENPTDEKQEFITAFFADKNAKVYFSEDGEYFTVK